MEPVISQRYEVHIGALAQAALNQHIAKNSYSKIFVLVDGNTKEHCLPPFLEKLEFSFRDADRIGLMINLGGGLLTDLWGFVASTYMRGIDFINIPTTLLSMVDASVGGKTGVDLGSLKNQSGLIKQPRLVLVFPEF